MKNEAAVRELPRISVKRIDIIAAHLLDLCKDFLLKLVLCHFAYPPLLKFLPLSDSEHYR